MRRTMWILAFVTISLMASSVPAMAGTAVLTWVDNSTNESNFDIERKASLCAGSASWGLLGSVGANVVTYRDATVLEGNSYCYRVNARNAAGKSGYSNEVGLTVPLAIPAVPSQLGVTFEP